ncbi:hypothetical protein HPB48_003423 [Haemaphysalis longicornis]|uniref:Uncharacterized protein n=1 Tax=Haemaphysalis longicornis TaxID=44386 RepID=A0A9J6GCQ9_HAELO|nr:hypothetical protein HPB48_003423 [Haemaphysalis longicornis]
MFLAKDQREKEVNGSQVTGRWCALDAILRKATRGQVQREVLEELVLQHFPPEVSQLAPGDPQLLCYAQAMRRLLAGLEGSGGSPAAAGPGAARAVPRPGAPHFLEPELQRALRRTMPRHATAHLGSAARPRSSRLRLRAQIGAPNWPRGQGASQPHFQKCSEAKQQELLRTVYQCAANRALSTSSRLGITSRLLPQLVQHASKPAVRQFFVGNIAAIMDTVASKMRAVWDPPLRGTWKLPEAQNMHVPNSRSSIS